MPNAALGSSPLARGALTLRLTLLRSTRLIPARAGNISRFSPILTSTAAHPRSRGEHREYPPGFFAGFGSSPLARGTLGARRKPYRSDSAHPRSRGEHCFKVNAKSESSGSSPLARGTSRVLLPPIHPVRLIPARAGNTRTPAATEEVHSAHPRSHGEHSFDGHPVTYIYGSSPLARGTLPGCRSGTIPIRLIPARTGNTQYCWGGYSAAAAHPRSHGEHTLAGREGRFTPGSSPLARGTFYRFDVPAVAVRLIPARAGNTLEA